MTTPKRHHWWPQLQSGHWTDESGFINVVRRDGTCFRSRPQNIGLEGELYTRYDISGAKDLTIEHWFSQEIETPFVEALARLASMDGVTMSPLPIKDLKKEQELRELGFVVPKYVEKLILSKEHRHAINRYIAALLVRNPRYLGKLSKFHEDHGTPLPINLPHGSAIRTMPLDNMLHVFEVYAARIADAHLGLVALTGSNEFLFSDAGLSAEEPWRPGPIPFSIHAPLTPTLALEILPSPDYEPRSCFIMRMNNQGAARMNRIALQGAERFVFSRQSPPLNFIKANFGKDAPKSIGYRMKNGVLETKYDRARDRP